MGMPVFKELSDEDLIAIHILSGKSKGGKAARNIEPVAFT
jgi:hypothetical protein